jgi:hypothetical protein
MAAKLVNPKFRPDTVEHFKKLYSEHADCISYKLKFGSAVEKAIAKTILAAAGLQQEGGEV